MIRYYIKQDDRIRALEQAEDNCWINISPPFNPEHLRAISRGHGIPYDYLIDSMDIDERSRFETEEDVTLIVIKTPVINEKQDDDALFITIPLGIIITPKAIITISAYDNPVTEDIIDGKIKNMDISNRKQFILKLFERNVNYFLKDLKEIDKQRSLYEADLQTSMKNENLFRLLGIEKSLVYFVTSLRSNELLMMKMHRLNILKLSEEEQDLLQDIVVDSSQALEMANIYTNIVSSTMDAFASIISNNLNVVMKRLTSVTIILMIPTLVASLYGMNVNLPFQSHPLAFAFTILASCLLIAGSVWYFLKRRWF